MKGYVRKKRDGRELRWRCSIGPNHYGDGDDDIYREERRGVLRISNEGFFFLSSDFFSFKTSSSSLTLETLAKINSYENNIFHNYYF